MFSNGTEYMCFLDRNCNDCRFFVAWEEATEKKPTCHIEQRIADCTMLDEEEAIKVFPYEWLAENGTMARYDCNRKNFKRKRFVTADKLPQYAKMTQEEANSLIQNMFDAIKAD